MNKLLKEIKERNQWCNQYKVQMFWRLCEEIARLEGEEE